MAFNTTIVTGASSDGTKQCPDIKCVEGVQLLANSDNDGPINFGPNSGTFTGTDKSFPLAAGKGIFLPVTNLDQIFIKTTDSGDQTLHAVVI